MDLFDLNQNQFLVRVEKYEYLFDINDGSEIICSSQNGLEIHFNAVGIEAAFFYMSESQAKANDTKAQAWIFTNGISSESSRIEARSAFGDPIKYLSKPQRGYAAVSVGYWDIFLYNGIFQIHITYSSDLQNINLVTISYANKIAT